jgi:hypothetical protein
LAARHPQQRAGRRYALLGGLKRLLDRLLELPRGLASAQLRQAQGDGGQKVSDIMGGAVRKLPDASMARRPTPTVDGVSGTHTGDERKPCSL